MKISSAITPTITETDEAIIIRIPKRWVGQPDRSQLTKADVLRIVAAGEREFRHGKTRTFDSFLAKQHPTHARIFRRAR